MANPEQFGKLKEGVEAWNRWRTSLASTPDLRNVDVSGQDLSRADLSRADLRGANFSGSNLSGASLREANLQGADLCGAKGGLQTLQLAGADLTGASLPEELKKLYDALQNVNDISESARKLFLAVLAASVYSWLTIASTTDVNLITNRASSPIPFIQASIPIAGFYAVAPLLLLCVYFYFHFYLQKLWEELGYLPAIFPDGRPLHTKIDPWLLNDLVRSHLPKLNIDRPFMSYFQQAISIALAWWLVPFTLFLFWGRYLSCHDFRWTTFHVVLLAISITAAVFLYRLAAASLLGNERLPFRPWTSHLKNLRFYSGAATFVVTGVLLMLVSIGAIRSVYPEPLTSWSEDSAGVWSWTPRAMALVGYSPFADLRRGDVSVKPSNWTGKHESELENVKGAELEGADLRYAEANRAFLAKADLAGANLEGADLTESDLQQAKFLGGTFFSRQSYIGNARLTGADLSGANLRQAFLRAGLLRGAYLTDADLTGALLNSADLSGTKLEGAELEFADFRSLPAGSIFAPTRGLTVEQIKAAKHWEKAYYDDTVVKELGLPPDHNAKIEEEEKRRKGQWLNQAPEHGTESPHDEKSPNASHETK